MICLETSDIFRIIISLIHAELKESRKTSENILPIWLWTEQTPISANGLEADSIELLTLAGAVNRVFHLSESGVEDYLLRYRRLGEWAEIVRQGMSRTYISFTTSGSTGDPKICTHEWSDLEQEIAVHAALFQQSLRIVSTVPAHHIYGCLFTVLLARYMNLPVLDLNRNAPVFLEKKLMTGDLIVSFPTYWKYLSDTILKFPEKTEGISSAEPSDPAIIQALLNKGLYRMTEIYGSSETGGIGFRQDYEHPYTLLPFCHKDSDSSVMRDLPGGGLSQSIRLSDRLDWQDERCFHITGRTDHAVQVAGINVFPNEVARKISAHTRIGQCVVRPVGLKGNLRLEAAIMLAPGISLTEEIRNTIRTWLYEQLSAPERPVSVVFSEYRG